MTATSENSPKSVNKDEYLAVGNNFQNWVISWKYGRHGLGGRIMSMTCCIQFPAAGWRKRDIARKRKKRREKQRKYFVRTHFSCMQPGLYGSGRNYCIDASSQSAAWAPQVAFVSILCVPPERGKEYRSSPGWNQTEPKWIENVTNYWSFAAAAAAAGTTQPYSVREMHNYNFGGT